MSDELQKKRQEKIANFKINFDQNESYNGNITEDINSSSNVSEKDRAVFVDDFGVNDNTDISSGEAYAGPIYTADKKMRRKKRSLASKRRRSKAKHNIIVFRVVWLTMVVLVSILLGEYIMVGVNDLLAVGREEDKKVSVTIPNGADIDQVTDILYENNIIKNPFFFKMYATVTKKTTGFTQGTFDVATNKDYQALINYLRSDMNRTDIVTIRFTEGMNIVDYAKLLEKNT